MNTATDRLAEIRQRFDKTTYGDWKIYETQEGTHIGTREDHPQLKSPVPVVTMTTWVEEPRKRIYMTEEDAAFIAHAKADMRWLLEQADKLAAPERQLADRDTVT